MQDEKYDIKNIHDECRRNKEKLENSKLCGCFYCMKIFPTSEIVDWVSHRGDEFTTAICPKCGIDSILPESDKYEITYELLEAMNKRWF